MFTQQRAQEVWEQCKQLDAGRYGPHNPARFMTAEEQATVQRKWMTMSGGSSWFSAFCEFLNGRVETNNESV